MLEPRVWLRQNEGENIGGVSRWIVFTDRWALPPNIEDHVLDRLFDDGALALWERRMLDHRKFYERVFVSARPIAVKLLSHLENIFRIYVARHQKCRIIRHIVARLNQPHHVCRRGRHSLTIA